MIKIYRCSKCRLLMRINCTSVRFLLLLFIETPTVGSHRACVVAPWAAVRLQVYKLCGAETCPTHPSLPGRLPTSGGTAVWAVTPACPLWPVHLLPGGRRQGHRGFLEHNRQHGGACSRRTETQKTGSEGWKWYCGWNEFEMEADREENGLKRNIKASFWGSFSFLGASSLCWSK